MNEVTDEAIEEGRVALIQLEQELKEKVNDAVSVGSNKHHSTTGDERRLLDQMPRGARLNNRLESLGLTVEELDDRGLLDGGGSVPSYYTSMKNKSRRSLELQSRTNRLQGRGKETFSKLLNSFLHMIRTLVRKGLNLEPYCRRHDPNKRGLMRKKAFYAMLKSIGLPFSNRELQDIVMHYIVPASDQADYVTLLKDAHIVNLGELNANLFQNSHLLDLGSGSALKEIPEGEVLASGAINNGNSGTDGNGERDHPETNAEGKESDPATETPAHDRRGGGDHDLGAHTTVLADVRRMLLDSIRSLNKDQDEVYRMFARWDTNGTGTVTATQFLRVLARLHVNLSDQEQDFLVELLDTSAMGRIDFEGLLSFCFTPGSPVGGEAPEILSPVAMSGGGSLSVGDWGDNVGNETMSAVSTENNSVDMKSFNSNALSGGAANRHRPRTATLSRPYNEQNVYNSTHGAAGGYGGLKHPAPQQQQQYYHPDPAGGDYMRGGAANNRGNTRMQRPMTASARVSTQNAPTTPTSTQQSGGGHAGRFVGDDDGPNAGRYIKTQSLVMDYGYTDRSMPGNNVGGNGRAAVPSKAAPAPANTTASAQPSLPRVGPHQPLSSHPTAPPQQPHQPHQKQLSFRNLDADDSQYVAELPDDVMYGEEKYLGADSNKHPAAGKLFQTGGTGNGGNKGGGLFAPAAGRSAGGVSGGQEHQHQQPVQSYHQPEYHDMGSYNDTLLTAEQEDYLFGAPKDIPHVSTRPVGGYNGGNAPATAGGGYQPMGDINHQQSGGGGGMGWMGNGGVNEARRVRSEDDAVGRAYDARAHRNAPAAAASANLMFAPHPHHTLVEQDRGATAPYDAPQGGGGAGNGQDNATYGAGQESPPPAKEPIEHLVLLANQILTTLREIIMARYRRGKSLQEIYQHFDRDDKNFFDARDFIIATSDLRIETSPRVANIAVNMIALDGYDKVSFGEFRVFVLDSDHKLLELNVQEQLAQMLEQKGREYQSFMIDMFWSEEESLTDSRTPASRAQQRQSEFVSKSAFVSSLQRIGLMLTSSELNRLVDRFDMYGNEMCSVVRFVRMVQNSRPWRHAERVLAYQDEAIEEAEYLRQQLSAAAVGDRGPMAHLPDLPEELISMCEYLGIRVLSEPNMVWIAADALKAPLPVSWTAQKDANGRTYFYNHLTNQSKLEHPLDPHFRKLRDKYRQGGSLEGEMDSAVGMHPTLTTVLASTAGANNTGKLNPNSGISFGGMGASLNPPPLHYNFNLQARPQPPQDQFAHLYPHANAAAAQIPVHGNHGSGQVYQNASLQPAASDSDRAYAKYGVVSNSPTGNGAQASRTAPNAAAAGAAGAAAATVGTAPRAGRRPQSALERVPQSSTAAAAGREPRSGERGGGSDMPLPVSTGMYTAELKALMGSAAYNRPLSAPNKHNVESLNAYTDAELRMKEKEERAKTTMEQLEAVYLTSHQRPTTAGATATRGASGANHANSGNRHVSAGGAPSSGVKWGTNPTAAGNNNTPMSAVDRALSIGRTNSGFFNTTGGSGTRQGDNTAGGQGAGPSRERARSAQRGTASSNLTHMLGRALPMDTHAKQSRLSEMFDDGILDKLDSAMGLGMQGTGMYGGMGMGGRR